MLLELGPLPVSALRRDVCVCVCVATCDAGSSLEGEPCNCFLVVRVKNPEARGGVKMAEKQDGETTFSSTNSSKEQNGEQSLQNNF